LTLNIELDQRHEILIEVQKLFNIEITIRKLVFFG